jgi:hypothetical protein
MLLQDMKKLKGKINYIYAAKEFADLLACDSTVG